MYLFKFCLQTITILGKPIHGFHSGAFLGLRVLKTLGLISCHIRDMPPLDPVKHTLEILNLRMNELVYIEANYFLGFSRLEILHFSHNCFLAIPNITPLAGILFRFNIERNSVATLKPVLLNASFTKLRYLYVAHNKVSELTPMMIRQWPRLGLLEIENNLLETLGDLSCITREFVLEVMTGNEMVRN